METEESKFKVRSVELVIDAEKIEDDDVCFIIKKQHQTVEFSLSKEQAKLLKKVALGEFANNSQINNTNYDRNIFYNRWNRTKRSCSFIFR